MKRIATNTAVLAAVLVLGSFASTADAADSLPARAVSALGVAIAVQGDAALLQIRREIRETAIDAVKPFLPDVQKVVEQQPPAATPVAQR
jgi:hypothetical protein